MLRRISTSLPGFNRLASQRHFGAAAKPFEKILIANRGEVGLYINHKYTLSSTYVY